MVQKNPMRLIDKDELAQWRSRNLAFEQLQEQGDRYVACERYGQARTYYRQAAIVAPDRPEPFIGLGAVALQTAQWDEALRAFQTARTLDPNCAEAWAGAAMIYQEQQRYPQAFELYLRCLEINSDNLLALLGLFQTSCQMGTFSQIIRYLERYLDSHPQDTSVLFCLASLYTREGLAIQAKQAVLAVLAAEPDKLEAAELLRTVEERLTQDRSKEVA